MSDIYEGLTGEAEREAAYEGFVWKNLRRNYAGHFVHGMLGMTGFRLVNAPTFIPAYLHQISGSDFFVSLGASLQQLGGVISPIAGAAQILPHEAFIGGFAFGFTGNAFVDVAHSAAACWMVKPEVRRL